MDKEGPSGTKSEAEDVKTRDKRRERAPHLMEGMEGLAVAVRGAYKRHVASSPVLNGLDMTVQEGHIYGLLGPSGCGKTTLLRSIVGIVRLDQGTIYVKAHWRDLLGYMPQDLGLYDYMTIMEAFHFYGKLYGMKKKDVNDKGSDLIDFLELPKGNRLIRNMSGGQQRRLSFAVTLLHDPDLMILDEPTVGLDPVLCASIWDRLVEMATGGKTIIITTHYIEETKQSNAIGLMRDGVLLAEKSPKELMKSQLCNSLEDAFLKLSEKQEKEKKEEEKEEENKPKPKKTFFCCKKANDEGYPKKEKKCWCISKEKKHTPTVIDPCPYWNTRRFWVQLVKNLKYLWRNYRSTLFNLLLPAFIALLCQLVLGKNIGHDKALGVVSPELGPRRLAKCDKTYDYDKNCTVSTDDKKLSCAIVQRLRKDKLKVIGYKDLAAGKRATRRNEVWGVLVFHANYSLMIRERITFIPIMKLTFPETVNNSYIDAYLDMSNMWISTYLRRTTTEAVRLVMRRLVESCQSEIPVPHMEKFLDNPISNMKVLYGDAEPPFLEFFLPGVVCTFAFYLSILFTTGAIMFERSVGLERSLVAGMTKVEVIVAHSLVQILLAIAQQFIILLVFYVIYKHTMVGSYLMIILLLIMLQIMGLFYGLILGLFFELERDATNAGVGTINALFMVAGVMWPYEGMHPYMRAVVPYVPVQPAVEAYRAIAMRGWTMASPTVYMGYTSTVVWTAVFILLTIALTRSHKDSL